MQLNSGAAERLIHFAANGKQLVNAEEMRSIKWSSWTCVIGSEVAGIWAKYAATNDVNAVDANYSAQVGEN